MLVSPLYCLQATAHDAFRALVNLSDSPLLVPSLSELSFLTFIVSYIIVRGPISVIETAAESEILQDPEAVLADLASMLLSNLTASSVACSALLSLKIPLISDTVELYPPQSRCGTCAAPVPYPSGDSRDVLALPLLVDAFVQGAQVDPSADPTTRKRKGELHFLSSVFANLSVVCTLVSQQRQYYIIFSRHQLVVPSS